VSEFKSWQKLTNLKTGNYRMHKSRQMLTTTTKFVKI